MKMTRSRCCRGLLLVALLIFSASGCSADDTSGTETTAERNQASPEDIRSDDELATAWWTWAASEPDATNPVVDDTGEDCGRNQPDDVWFLAGNFGGETQRTCSIPLGRDLFFPVLNAFCGENDGCESWFDDAALSVVFNGEQIDSIEIDTDVVEIEAAKKNSVTVDGGKFEVVVAGWWVRLPAPASGSHSLEIFGRSADGFEVSVSYDITIK